MSSRPRVLPSSVCFQPLLGPTDVVVRQRGWTATSLNATRQEPKKILSWSLFTHDLTENAFTSDGSPLTPPSGVPSVSHNGVASQNCFTDPPIATFHSLSGLQTDLGGYP